VIAQYLFIALLLLMTVVALASAWKSLRTGKAQPASFFLKMQGKQPIIRAQRPFAYWTRTLAWVGLVPLSIVFSIWMTVTTLTWPPCSHSVKEQCWYAAN